MSRVDRLVAELIPNGVVFKPIGEVTSKSSNIKWANVGDTSFQYIDLTSVDRQTKKIGDTATISQENAPSRAQQIVRTGDVIFATTRPTQMRWAKIPWEFDGQVASTGYCVIRPDEEAVLAGFLAHLLGTDSFRRHVEANQVAGNYPSIPDSRIRAYQIPIPPLELQQEIVRVLDNFTELEVELQAELDARRLQYAHFREELFGGDIVQPGWRQLGEIGEFFRGRRFTKADFVDVGIPSIHYGEIYTHYGVSTSVSVRQVRGDLRTHLMFARPGDVVIASVGETVEEVGKAVAWLGVEPVAIHDDTLGFRSSLDPKFVAYWLQTEAFHSQKNQHVARGKIKRLSSSTLASIRMPMPSREEQRQVVEVLDRFDALVSDLSVGLPAELVARRKQYEYYRDKLLTFEEAPG